MRQPFCLADTRCPQVVFQRKRAGAVCQDAVRVSEQRSGHCTRRKVRGIWLFCRDDRRQNSNPDAPIGLTQSATAGPISALTVTRASAIRPTQGSQFAEQPKLDGAGRFLIIPDLLLTACDEHGNRCNSLLEATVEAELRMQGEAEEELALHGDEL
eukprot:2835651-Rhodomonas_salina.2